MGGMEQTVFLDTDVIIGLLLQEKRAEELVKKIDRNTTALSTISLFELLLRKTNLAEPERLISKMKVIAFDEDSARQASIIAKQLKNKGRPIEYRDVFIAATCIVNQCPLATFKTRHFSHIPGLALFG